MTNTTKDKVRAIASHLDTMSDDALDVIIDDAIMEVAALGVSPTYHERLQRWLTAHLATLNVRRGTSKSAGDVSVSYTAVAAGPGLMATEYGQEYQRLLNKLYGGYLRVM